jgi:transcription antitermination factor NusG
MTRWAVGIVETGDEFGVAERLRKIDVESYCPVMKVRARPKRMHGIRMRRRIEVERVMLAGYLLIDWGSIGNLETVNRIPGFYCFLRWADDGRPQFVSEDALAGVRALEANARGLPDALIGRFIAGAAVRVDSGFLEGNRGIVEDWLRDKDRVLVSGGDFTIPVEFPAEQLEVEG